MISPIGSFMVQFDAAITAGMNAGITGLTAYLAPPVMTCLAIYYVIQGIRIVQGDGAPVQHFVTQLLRNVMILWFCSNADIYNRWVRDIFFVGLPTALNKAIMTQTVAGVPPPASMANGVTGTAALFDSVWALMDQQVGLILSHAPLLDFGSRMAAVLFGLTGGLALLIIAMVYLMTRFILAIVIEIGVVAVACLIFDATKPIFERWLGKIIALVVLQVTAIVVLQIVLTVDQNLMKQIVAAGGGVPDQVQGLMSMVVLFFMGAFAIYSLSAIAYSIGTGVSISSLPVMLMAAKAMQTAAAAMAGMTITLPTVAAAEAAESLSLGIARSELGGGSGGVLAPPSSASLPPPPLSLPSP
jgi:type IV secretion system protein VirB6